MGAHIGWLKLPCHLHLGVSSKVIVQLTECVFALVMGFGDSAVHVMWLWYGMVVINCVWGAKGRVRLLCLGKVSSAVRWK